jgi:hypothetical protein
VIGALFSAARQSLSLASRSVAYPVLEADDEVPSLEPANGEAQTDALAYRPKPS